jgi:TetR/AcrR family transcriptional repressor of nem operon
VEHDEGNAALRACARRAMDRWRRLVVDVLRGGQARGEVTAALDPEGFATFLFATFEGAVMLAGLYRDLGPVRHCITHLSEAINHQLRP